jgi:hypothetical protein
MIIDEYIPMEVTFYMIYFTSGFFIRFHTHLTVYTYYFRCLQ